MTNLQMTAFRPFFGTFDDRLSPGYFTDRTDVFSGIVGKTHDHFWNPDDRKYIDFSTPFDIESNPVMPFEMIPELSSGLGDSLSNPQKIRLANDSAHWWLSGFLHGEQGALSTALSLIDKVQDPGAVEFLVNQAREEARHVNAFTQYIASRWGAPLAVNPVFGRLLNAIVSSPMIHRQIVGMQILVEGLAMGFMAALYTKANDPVLVRLAQLVMTDEVFHHKAGKMWAEVELQNLSPEDRCDAEDWALQCFQALMFNVFNPSQKSSLYAPYGWTVEQVGDSVRQSYTSDTRRKELSEEASVFRVVIRTLLGSGIVTERTKVEYERWINFASIDGEGAASIESAITSGGLALLEKLNQ